MNIVDIKLGLELWDNRQPVEPPLNKHDEILYDTIKMRANIFENNAVESVRYLLHIIDLLEQDLTYMKEYGELTGDVKIKSCIDRALQAIREDK